MHFTLFVILPVTNDVCTLRNVQHGSTIREIRCRLELEAGIPAQSYRLHNSDGQYMHEEHCLLLDQNVWDGYILRTQLFESWLELYDNIIKDRVDEVIKSGAIRADDNMATDKAEQQKLEAIITERGSVALYIASSRGLFEMCSCLLLAGVNPNGRTPFGRTALFAAICRDNDAILELLFHSGANLEVKDFRGETPLMFARRLASKLCFRKLRLWSLDRNGLRPLRPVNGVIKHINVNLPANRKLRVKFQQDEPLVHMPRPPTSQDKSKNDRKASAKLRESNLNIKTTLDKSPRTSGRSLPKRETDVQPSSKDQLLDNPARPTTSHVLERPSSQCFVWDIDDRTKRDSVVGIRLPSAKTEPRSKSAKHAVRWRDESLVETGISPKPQSGKSNIPVTILKNKAELNNLEKRSNLIRTLSKESLDSDSSTIKSENQSHPDSELTLVSAPGDGSRLKTSDNRSVESAPASSVNKTLTSKVHRHKGSVRLLPFRRKANEDRATSAKRQINILEKQKRKERLANAETFEQWLERKRMQECRERLVSHSEDSSQESDSEGANAAAYEDWMQKRGRRKLNPQHHMTVEELYRWKDRPLRGIVTVGEAQIADTIQPPEPPDNNMRSYQRWKEKRQKPIKPIDVEAHKTLLERKRQQLLAVAITYEDWLETAEQKKLLMKKILQADMKELERIEEENLMKRSPRQISFDRWNNNLLKKEFAEKQRRDKERRDAEALKEEQLRSSLCVTHDVWLERKRQAAKLKQRENKYDNSPRTKQDRDAAFASWVKQKQLQEEAEQEVDLTQGR